MKLTVKTTLGKLKESTHGIHGQIERESSIDDFFADKVIDKVYEHYGQYNESTITLNDGNDQEYISLKGFEFSKTVLDVFYFQKSSTVVSHKFTFVGRSPEGKIFEVTLSTNTEETLPSIIYAIVFMTHVRDIDVAKRFWDEIQGDSMRHLLVGDLLNDMIRLHGIAKNVIQDYPFMEFFFQQGLETIKSNVKERLDSLCVLHENNR